MPPLGLHYSNDEGPGDDDGDKGGGGGSSSYGDNDNNDDDEYNQQQQGKRIGLMFGVDGGDDGMR